MFLSLLNQKQKKLFFSFAYNLATIDNDFSENEKILMKSYSVEMNMEFELKDVERNITHVISALNEICMEREKRIIIFELIGLAMSDDNFDRNERKIVQNAMSVWGVSNEFGSFCEKKLLEYFKLQRELNQEILA